MSKIETLLNSMGKTSEEVAAFLEENNITGERHNKRFCPIVKAIYQKIPDLPKGLIVNSVLYIDCDFDMERYVRITWNDPQTLDPNCPDAVQEFVIDFDKGKYPHLVGKTQNQVKQQVLDKLSQEERMSLGL